MLQSHCFVVSESQFSDGSVFPWQWSTAAEDALFESEWQAIVFLGAGAFVPEQHGIEQSL